MSKLIYRKTKETDIKELTMIMKRAFDDDTKRHTDLLEDGPQGYDDGSLLKRLLALKDGATFTIYLDKKIIGAYTILKKKETYHLEILFIDPSLTDKGLGQKVWKDIEASNKEAQKWVLETPSYSLRNHHFYEKCGFKRKEDKGVSIVFEKIKKAGP